MNREQRKFSKPLSKRRDGKTILLAWAEQFIYSYSGGVKPGDISEWHLNDFECRVQKPRCRKCRDTGHVGAGPAPPMTGISCMNCTINKERQAEFVRVKSLEDRVRKLEALLADKQLDSLP